MTASELYYEYYYYSSLLLPFFFFTAPSIFMALPSLYNSSFIGP